MNSIEINSLNEFEKYVKLHYGTYDKQCILQAIEGYKETFYSEQRERDYNAQEEQKEIESNG